MLKVDQNFQIAIRDDSKLQFKMIERLVDRGTFYGSAETSYYNLTEITKG